MFWCIVYSNTQPSCHLITNLVAKETAHIVTMTITSDWISTDLCVCYLSTSYDSTYLTFDLVAPSDSDAICGPYLTVEPISGSSFYNVCPRSGSSPHGATISNQSSITVALWSKDPNKSLLGANITFHSELESFFIWFCLFKYPSYNYLNMPDWYHRPTLPVSCRLYCSHVFV